MMDESTGDRSEDKRNIEVRDSVHCGESHRKKFVFLIVCLLQVRNCGRTIRTASLSEVLETINRGQSGREVSLCSFTKSKTCRT